LKAILILGVAFAVIAALVLVGLRSAKATRVWPAALLVVTAPLEVYRSSSGAGLNLSLFRIALLVGMVAYVVDLRHGRKRLPQWLAMPFVLYAGLVAWQLVSLAFVTPNHSLAYRFLGQYVAGLLAAFIITRYVARRDLYLIAAVCGAGAVLPLVAAAYRVFSVRHGGSGDLPGLSELPLDPTIQAARRSGSFLLDGTQRLNATFSDPNHFGFYIATVFLIMLGAVCRLLLFVRPIPREQAAAYALLTTAAGVAMVGTYSRSTWLLGLVGVLLLGLLAGRSVWSRRRVLVTAVVGAVVLGLASPVIASRLGTSERGNAVSTHVHEHTMRIAVKLIAQHPVLGVGLGGYGHHAGQPPIISSAHSTFFTVAAELGVVGVSLLLGAMAVTSIGAIKSARKTASGDRVLIGAFAAAYTGLAVANLLYEVWMDDFQWVLFGLVLAVTMQAQVSLRWLPLPFRRAAPAAEGPPEPARPQALA
jgi:hypothetical protein